MAIGAGAFKAQCLRLMDEVQQTRKEIVITKRGKPIAKLVPIEEVDVSSICGFLEGTVEIKGDIVAPIGEMWNAED